MHLLDRLDGFAVQTAILGLPGVMRSASPPRVVDVSAGFIRFSNESSKIPDAMRRTRIRYDAQSVSDLDAAYSFGVVVGIARDADSRDASLRDDLLPSQLIGIDQFPVVAEFREISYAAPPRPSGACAACYAVPRTSKRFFGRAWRGGVVVARHSLASVGFVPGSSVPMASGAALSLVDIDVSDVIDAAVLDCGLVPAGATGLPLAPAVAPGSPVSVRAASGSFAADVLLINDHPKYYGNLLGHRIFIDSVGSLGDSGALATRTVPHSDGVGMYMGTTGGAMPEGVLQSMRQVVNYFDVDLYD
jgi:hypothetical protein